VFNDGGSLTVTACTIAYNNAVGGTSVATFSGANGQGIVGGVFVNGGTVRLDSTIVAKNTAANMVSPDVMGTFASDGSNLVGDGTGSTGLVDGTNDDQVGTAGTPTDPMLDSSLKDNGGPTQTIALLNVSPALNHGDETDGVFVDQRGAQRGANAQYAGTLPDIGATRPVPRTW
jgi:hypothetical protein